MKKSGLIPVPPWASIIWPVGKPHAGFVPTPHPLVGDYVWTDYDRKLCVICSASVESDGKRWIHVSTSRPSGLPTWEDLKRVKRAFIGNIKAIQVFPKEEEYVNINPNVLHLWACIDGDIIPDFRKDGQI